MSIFLVFVRPSQSLVKRCKRRENSAGRCGGYNSAQRRDYVAPAPIAEALGLPALSIATPSPEAIASTIRRSSAVNASRSARYRASTAVIPADPSIGTASAERSVLYFVGSFR